MEIEINISRPVTLGGLGFMKTSFGAIASKDKEIIDKHKKEISKLINSLLKVLQEKYGKEIMITTNFIIEIDDNIKTPKKALVKKIIIWEPAKIIQENIEVSL
jgi:beta-xylosidase